MQGGIHLPGLSVVGRGGDLLQAITLSPPSHKRPPFQRESHPVGQNQMGSLKRQWGIRRKNSPGVRGSLRADWGQLERHGRSAWTLVKGQCRRALGLKSELEAGRSQMLRGVMGVVGVYPTFS